VGHVTRRSKRLTFSDSVQKLISLPNPPEAFLEFLDIFGYGIVKFFVGFSGTATLVL
jgi:hypothetical protein